MKPDPLQYYREATDIRIRTSNTSSTIGEHFLVPCNMYALEQNQAVADTFI